MLRSHWTGKYLLKTARGSGIKPTSVTLARRKKLHFLFFFSATPSVYCSKKPNLAFVLIFLASRRDSETFEFSCASGGWGDDFIISQRPGCLHVWHTYPGSYSHGDYCGVLGCVVFNGKCRKGLFQNFASSLLISLTLWSLFLFLQYEMQETFYNLYLTRSKSSQV